MSVFKRAVLVALLAVACTPGSLPAVQAESLGASKPDGLDNRSWASLKNAIGQVQGISAPAQIRLEGAGSSLGSDGSEDDRFGYSVDLDGDTALVGIPQDASGAGYSGSAYVFQWSGSDWEPQAKLVADGAYTTTRLGMAVAIRGDTAVVGAPFTTVQDKASQGAVWVFTRHDGVWSEQAILIAADGASSDLFGSSVAISGDTILVGAERGDSSAVTNSGAAYVFSRQGSSWILDAKLQATDGAPNDFFGASVALEGNTALVGAYWHDVDGRANQGAVYAFRRLQSGWEQQAKLAASDGAALEEFGRAVDLQGGRAVIGSEFSSADPARRGAAYVFAHDGVSWAEEAKLTSWDSGVSQQGFGRTVGISGDTVFVGAPRAAVGSNLGQGAAYFFRRTAQGWAPLQKLSGTDAGAVDEVATSIALDAGRVLLGTPNARVGNNNDQGVVYAFSLEDSTWSERGKLTSGTGAGNAQFGLSVDVDGRIAVVGAGWENVGASQQQGAAYVFTRDGTEWSLASRLTAGDGRPLDRFGSAVAIAGNTVVVGAPFAQVGSAPTPGAVYVFSRSTEGWTEHAKLVAPGEESPLAFGSALSIDGDALLVGMGSRDLNSEGEGGAFVFRRSGSIWSFEQRLRPVSGAPPKKFGYSVAIEGNMALVGSPLSDEGGDLSRGSAYLFQRQGESWVEQYRLFSEDGAAGDRFGYSVNLSGDTAIVSAPMRYDGPGDVGAVYMYRRASSDWMPEARFSPSDLQVVGEFAWAVALNGDWAFVTLRESAVNASGVLLLLVRRDGVWSKQAEWPLTDGSTGEVLSSVLAFDGTNVLIGSPTAVGRPPYGNENEGAAFLYENVLGLFEDGFEPRGTQEIFKDGFERP